jgi:hypothetical protein
MIDITDRRFAAILRHEDGDFAIVTGYARTLAGAEEETIERYLSRSAFRNVTIESLAWCDYIDKLPEWGAP